MRSGCTSGHRTAIFAGGLIGVAQVAAHLVEALVAAVVLGAISSVLLVVAVRARRRERAAAADPLAAVVQR